MDTKTIIIITTITIVAMVFVVWGMYYLMKQAIAFNKEADRIEHMIKSTTNDDTIACKLLKQKIFNEIKALSAKSFHRTTGDRVRQLAKMFEVKFDVTITRG